MARDKQAPERKTGVAGWKESEGIGRKDAAKGRAKRSLIDRRRRLACIVCVLVACVACVWVSWPLQESITRGLWFKGGTATTMKAAGEISADDLSSSVGTVNKRLGEVGVSEYAAESSGSDAVVVKLPWNLEDGAKIAEEVGGKGQLEFVRQDEIGDADALTAMNMGTGDAKLKEGTYTAFLDGSHVKSASTVLVGDGVYAVTIQFDDEGTKKFAEVTEELAKDYGSIAVVVDGKIISAPSVSEKIDGGQVSITGNFSQQQAGALKAIIDSGTLPVDFKASGTEEIGALAGGGAVRGLAIGVVVAIAVVSAVAFAKVRKLGLLVLATQLIIAVLMLGFMAIASRIEVYVLSIPALLGGIFACGCGVACAWAVLSQFRAMVASGKSVRGSSLSAVGEALGSLAAPLVIVSTVSLVMLFLPFAVLRDLGLSVAIGIIASIVAVLLFEVPLLRVLATGSIQENPAGWGLEVAKKDAATASSNPS